ncbi:MAG: 30S ribosomal protein S14 [Gammaproteobacteria bacterium]
MARLALINKENHRTKVADRYRQKRDALKEELRLLQKDFMNNAESIIELQAKLNDMPRDASDVRRRNRCQKTGRPRGYYRRFGLGRSKLREYAMNCYIPGLVKSSW